MQKIALGTVQFGLDYGIHNQRGQVSPQEVEQLLKYAFKNGMDTLDTAAAYGNSEMVLGVQGVSNFKIVSKLFPQERDIMGAFKTSIRHLNVQYLYAYLIHRFADLEQTPEVWEKLKELNQQGVVKKIGVSLYSPEELEYLWNNGIEPDIIQIPYNIFDRRFERLFEELKHRNVEIHTRSTFLQGLFFKSPGALPPFFNSINVKLKNLHQLCDKYHLLISHCCLGFSLVNSYIDRVVIGVDCLEQLQQNLEVSKHMHLISSIIPDLKSLQVEEEQILNPANWIL